MCHFDDRVYAVKGAVMGFVADVLTGGHALAVRDEIENAAGDLALVMSRSIARASSGTVAIDVVLLAVAERDPPLESPQPDSISASRQ